ncbi:MAG: hypothetical protein M3Y72_24215 [Acidobacteriota bacterium]|nr:hypothetical protein [Acidobacteriota bacterium]
MERLDAQTVKISPADQVQLWADLEKFVCSCTAVGVAGMSKVRSPMRKRLRVSVLHAKLAPIYRNFFGLNGAKCRAALTG